MKVNIGVIFGGESLEHEISIISALQAIENFDRDKYNVIPIYIDKKRNWYVGNKLTNINEYKNIDKLLKNSINVNLNRINNEFWLVKTSKLLTKKMFQIDLAFPIVHGMNIEDGSLIGYLSTIGIPYVGSNVLASALGQDKVVLKQILENNNIPIVKYIWFYDYEYNSNSNTILKKINEIGYPVVVKSASLGSSIGISYVKSDKDIEEAIINSISYDKKVIVEKAVDNFIEVNCSVLGNYKKTKTSITEQIISNNDILTYKDKYDNNFKESKIKSVNKKVPANINKELEEKIKMYSKKVFKVLNFSGVCRIDFLIDSKTNEIFLNEPNVIPGSLSSYLWEKSNISYKKLIDELIKIGINEHKESLKKIKSLNNNILNNNYINNKNYIIKK